MKNASKQLSDVLKSINEVKKTLRNKKNCYENCKSEEIRKLFLIVLQSDLFLLHTKLDSWIDAGAPMEEAETTDLSNIQKEFKEE